MLNGFVYSIVGVITGVLSIFVFPDIIVQDYALKIANFVFSPILLGYSLCLISWLLYRRARGETIFALDKFVSGILFAAVFSFTRFLFTH